MPAIISGIVFNDLNHNGVFNTGEPGIADAFVVLTSPSGVCTSTQTDASGNYSFTGITVAGAYTIWETVIDPGATCPPTVFTQPDGFNESTTPRQIDRTVTAANISGNVNLSGNNFGHDNLAAFGCQSFAYQVQGNPTVLTRIDLKTGATVNLGGLSPSTAYGGTGYNPIDGNFWGYDFTNNRVGRITANRTNTTLPAIPNLPVQTYNVGDVDANGYLYLYSTSTASFFVVDVNSNRGTYGRLVDPANSFAEQTAAPFGVAISTALAISDWAFNPQDGQLYGVGSTSGSVGRINPVTGTTTGLTTTPATTGTYGASFFDNNNNLYEIENTSGQVFKYAISGNNATRTFFSQSVAASTNDGVRCAAAPITFANILSTKTATPIVGVGDSITYTIVLTNNGNTTATGVTLIDTIPTGTSFVSGSVTLDNVSVAGDPSPPSGVTLGTLGVGVHTVVFRVTATTIPDPNPVPNSATGAYSFLDTPNTIPFTDSYNTNTASTTVNYAIMASTKAADKRFVTVGDTVTYTITLQNTGNTTATSFVLIDTIPDGTTFVTGSVKQDTSVVSGSPNPPGVTLPNSIIAGGFSTVTFSVRVTTTPTTNPIPNTAAGRYSYTGNPQVPTTKTDITNSNTVNVQFNQAVLGITKATDKLFADCGETVTYTIVIPNSGNVTATNVVFRDTIPSGTVLVADSVTVNGTTQTGASPQAGINLGTIAAGGVTTVVFKVTVQC